MQKKTVITKLPAGNIVEIRKLADGTLEVVQEVRKKMTYSNTFVLIDVENLSMEDEFMQYVPKTEQEIQTKELISEAINRGIRNFYRPKYDPAFNKACTGVGFSPNRPPAIGKTYAWWLEAARKLYPEYNSRLGTKLEYAAFLGVLIKKLIKEGNTVEWAWNAVCNDSRELGHYVNSKDSVYSFECTGSRCVCGFYDLGNVYKLLAEENESDGFWLAGGRYCNMSFGNPIALLAHSSEHDWDCEMYVGWIILS